MLTRPLRMIEVQASWARHSHAIAETRAISYAYPDLLDQPARNTMVRMRQQRVPLQTYEIAIYVVRTTAVGLVRKMALADKILQKRG